MKSKARSLAQRIENLEKRFHGLAKLKKRLEQTERTNVDLAERLARTQAVINELLINRFAPQSAALSTEDQQKLLMIGSNGSH